MAGFEVSIYGRFWVSTEEEREDRVTREARELVADLHIELDVTNEARVHIWYPARFAYSIQPYQSTEDAIGTWPTTATAIGVRQSGRQLEVWAPFGTDDLFNPVVRPNRVGQDRQRLFRLDEVLHHLDASGEGVTIQHDFHTNLRCCQEERDRIVVVGKAERGG